MSVAVVIPFFQRKPGLLRRAVSSIGEQVGVPPVRVVVVDDASPIDAKDELAELPTFATPLEIEIVRQPNGGPAKARNRGLDALAADVDRVAFLDSDDVWRPHHLAQALSALDADHDVYFCDFHQPGQTVGAFGRAGRLDPSRHPAFPGRPSLHTYQGDMFDQVMFGNVIGTSTIVYAFDRFATQRFDEAYFSAGEDYLMWIEFARRGARFAFSSDIGVDYGYGVNIYAGSGWGTDGFLDRVHNEMRYRKRLLAFPLSAAQRTLVDAKIRALRREFAMGVMFNVFRRRPLDVALLRAQWRLDPLSLVTIPTEAGTMAAERIRGRVAARKKGS